MKRIKKTRVIMLIFIICAICIIGLIINKNIKANNSNSISKISSIEELVERYDCVYYKKTTSDENNYKSDIYLLFPIEPLNSNGDTQQYYYEKIISEISLRMKKKNYRIIDEKRKLIIRVQFQEDGTVTYSVNGDYYYFHNIKQQHSIEKINKIDIKEFAIQSKELSTLINNMWTRKESLASLGTEESSCDDYHYYFDEGYRIKSVNTKVYNIVFTKQYKSEVLDGITTNMSINDIEEKLGEATYKDSTNNIVGYKAKDFYVFFSEGEISIYKLDEYDEEQNKKFASLYTNYSETGDYETFLDELTNLYKDYTRYDKSKNEVRIEYPNRGFEIVLGNTAEKGIYIYDNYKGLINNSVSAEQLVNDKKIIKDVYVKVNTSLIFENEVKRIMESNNRRKPQFEITPEEMNIDFVLGNKFTVINDNRTYKFYSIDKENIDSEISVNELTKIYQYNDNIFIYGIKNDGIYYYDASNKKNEKIVSDNGECNIEKIENNTIYYDSKNISI